jgi:integrase
MGSIYKRGRVYWLKYYAIDPETGAKRPIRESSATDRFEEAKTLLRQREGTIANGTVITPKTVRLTFAEAGEGVINDYRINGKRSLEDVTRHIKRHLAPFFGRRRMAAISTADVRQYIALRQGQGAKNATINRELAALKRSFTLAIAAGTLSARPPIPMLREDNVRKGFFEETQFEAVRAALQPDVADLVLFLYITGWRWCSEAALLKWSNVDFTAGEIRLDPGTTKTGEGRLFPFTRQLRDLLERRRALTRERERELGRIIPFVFHRDFGQPIRSFRKAWLNACRIAGVPGRVPHDFRRTAVRNLVRHGVSEKIAMAMVGWKSRQMLDRYNVVSTEDLHEAARRLDQLSQPRR